jgi:hypothetical protein
MLLSFAARKSHGFWDVAAVFPFSLCAGLHAPDADVLANPYAHLLSYMGLYADHQSAAAAKALHLNWHFRRRRVWQVYDHEIARGLFAECAKLTILQS